MSPAEKNRADDATEHFKMFLTGGTGPIILCSAIPAIAKQILGQRPRINQQKTTDENIFNKKRSSFC
jgi:hypothetical protein